MPFRRRNSRYLFFVRDHCRGLASEYEARDTTGQKPLEPMVPIGVPVFAKVRQTISPHTGTPFKEETPQGIFTSIAGTSRYGPFAWKDPEEGVSASGYLPTLCPRK
jgi:hypothetical protein